MVASSLQAIRIEIAAYTASFRVPSFVGYQLTLPVPPLSTIFGLLSAAAGQWITPHDVEWLAYRCAYESRVLDVETIVQIEREKPHSAPRPRKPPQTTNVKYREFLLFPCLVLYLPPGWVQVFRCPRFALLLGRTQDVAYVATMNMTELVPVHSGETGGILLPFELVARNNVSAWVHNLPIAFTDEPLRHPIRMHLFGVVDGHHPVFLKEGDDWLVKDAQDGAILVFYRREWMLSGA